MLVARRNLDKCDQCGFCREVACSNRYVGYTKQCTGCRACYLACPSRAIEMVDAEREWISIRVDGEVFSVPEGITVLHALEMCGYTSSEFPGEGDIFAPCKTGGCWSCAVMVDGEVKPSCVTPVHRGADISVNPDVKSRVAPKRLVHGWMGHHVGGVGTPWWIRKPFGFVEVSCFACGCNLRCPQCQNWVTTYGGREEPLTPREAALLTTDVRRRYRVERMAISGGECTLNREWLVQYLQELRKRNPDARLHVDTNASILTPEYVDALVDAGMTDIGLDLKALEVSTYQKITGMEERIAKKYLDTVWEALKYLVDHHRDRVFVGVGIPYNRGFISLEEIRRMGEQILKIDEEVQVCGLDYRPAFREWSLQRPSYEEMTEVWRTLSETGLKNVVCQSSRGYIIPRQQ